jgi:hypothetical protein
MYRVAFVDDQLLCKDFKADDSVRKTSLRDYILTPYVGKVLFSNERIGKVAVKWPWGIESESPAELVKVVDANFVANESVDSYDTHESASANRTKFKKTSSDRKLSFADASAKEMRNEFETLNKPVYIAAAKSIHDGKSEIQARHDLVWKFAKDFGYDAVNDIVNDVYGQGYRLAIYWKASQRKYQLTKSEISSGKMNCPRCRKAMGKVRYKHQTSLSQCKRCGFAITHEDILKSAPMEEPKITEY